MKEILKLLTDVFLSNFKRLEEPYKITFSITNKCNSKCEICNIWKREPENELSLEEIGNIFKNISPSWINLTGGEPFLRNDLYKVAETIKDENVYLLNLTTNGLLGDKIVETVKNISELGYPKFTVVVSLDGPKEVHDEIRGVDGNWEKAVKLYRKLRQLSQNKRNFHTFFGYTISEYNKDLIKETFAAVKKRINGITMNDFHFNIYHSSFYYGNEPESSSEDFKRKIPSKIEDVLKQKNNLSPISSLEKKYLEFTEKYLKDGTSPLPCKSLMSSCFIRPNGDVYPCTHYNKKLGNLRQYSYKLNEIWKSEKAEKARRQIKSGKCPGCWTPCEAYQTILGNIPRIYTV